MAQYTLRDDPDLAPDLRADLTCSEREAAEDERFRTPEWRAYRRDLRASIARTEIDESQPRPRPVSQVAGALP